MKDRSSPNGEEAKPVDDANKALVHQARTRLRRIEGQVRGIQGMLERMGDESDTRDSLNRRVREMLAGGARQAEVARALGVSRQRVSELARGRGAPEGEPCDSLLTQVLAVRSALEQVGLIIMELHIQRCILGDLAPDEAKLKDLRDALKLWTRLTSKAPPALSSSRARFQD